MVYINDYDLPHPMIEKEVEVYRIKDDMIRDQYHDTLIKMYRDAKDRLFTRIDTGE